MEELIEGVNAKYCSKCKVLKEYEAFSKSKKHSTGRSSACRECKKAERLLNIDKVKERQRKYYLANQEKLCAKSAEFRKNNPEVVSEGKKKWYSENREYAREKGRRYYDENRERIIQRAAEWVEKNREYAKEQAKLRYERTKALTREHRKACAAKYRALNKEKRSISGRIYRSNNKPKLLANTRKRQLAKTQRTPNWLTNEDLKNIEDFYTLSAALSEVTGEKFQVDHIIPLQGELVSGLHVPSNLQILTAFENLSKGNKFNPEEFNNGDS